MITQSFGLNPDTFAAAFPYNLVLDRELRIAQAGPELLAQLPGLVGAALADIFALAPDQTPASFAALAQQPGAEILLGARTGPLLLRGRLVHDRTSGYLFVLSNALEWREPCAALESAGEVASQPRVSPPPGTYEHYFQALVALAPVGIFTSDANGQCQFVNQRWQEIMKMPFEAALGDGWAKTLHPDDRARVFEAWQMSMEQGREFSLEYRFIQDNGSIVWVAGTAVALYNDQGALDSYLGTIVDITARKRAEAALAESEATLRSFYESAPFLMGVLELQNDDLVFVSVNQTGAKRFGEAQADLRGQALSKWLSQDQVKHWLASCHTCLDTGQPVTFEYQRQMGDHLSWRKATIGAIASAPGDRPHVAYVVQDITEQRTTEQALRTAEAQYRTLVEQVPAIIYIADIDPDGPIHYISPQVESISGITPAEWIANPEIWFRLIHPDDVARVRQALEFLHQGASEYSCEYRGVTSDGRVLWLQDNARVVYDDLGQPLFVQGITIDITARKQFEAELAAARDEALAASRYKSEFLATVSHEIRTPMNGIIGTAELLQETALDQQQRWLTSVVQDSAHALLSLIDDILDFSKIEAGKLTLESTDVDLFEVIEGCAELMAARASAQELTLLTWIAPELMRPLRGDAGRLRQVLLNLVSNAVKFTPAGGTVTIEAELVRETDDDVFVACSVRDTGIGIAAAALERLFQPFTQADGSVTRKYGGTGLGLAISQRLVELMDGKIDVVSAEGHGSTFRFTARLAASPTSADPQPLPPLRVLIVEEHAPTSNSLRHILAAWGLSPDTAPSVQAALLGLRVAAAQGVPYDLVLTGLKLPDDDAFGLRLAIQAEPMLRELPLLLLATFSQRDQAALALERGFAAVLAKPIRQLQLFNTIYHRRNWNAETGTHGAQPPEPRAPQMPIPINSARILVVDDHPINQQLASYQLASLGYVVDVAANGRQAIEAATAQSFALIFMDCQMPEIDGFAATRAIRAYEEGSGRRTPIVAVTANTSTGISDACFAAGMDGYLSKPVTRIDLAHMLKQYLQNQASSSAPPKPMLPNIDGPLDRAVLESIQMATGDPSANLLGELIDIFVAHTPVQITALRAAIAQGDTAQIAEMAHRLQGSSVTMGATDVAAHCAALEHLAQNGTLDAVREELPQLEHALAWATQALQSLRHTGLT